MEFKEFDKIARLNREVVVTEKIDGTNGLVADMAIDALDPALPMTRFLDEWIRAYATAGGRRRMHRD